MRGTMRLERSTTGAILGLSLLGAGMLLWPLLGNPPYGYYSPMNIIVPVIAALGAWACFLYSRWLSPVSLALLGLALLHMGKKMRKEQWAPFNWVGVALFGFVALIMLFGLLGRIEKEPLTEQHQEGVRAWFFASLIAGLFNVNT